MTQSDKDLFLIFGQYLREIFEEKGSIDDESLQNCVETYLNSMDSLFHQRMMLHVSDIACDFAEWKDNNAYPAVIKNQKTGKLEKISYVGLFVKFMNEEWPHLDLHVTKKKPE